MNLSALYDYQSMVTSEQGSHKNALTFRFQLKGK